MSDHAHQVGDNAEVILRQGYRVIRIVVAERDSPWPGELISGPSGETVLAVDSALLGDAWAGWDAAPSGHVLSPLDVLRRPDGHDVLLPVLTERLEEFLSKRSGSAGDLSAGEAVTVVVSVLRGCAEVRGATELSGRAEVVRGSWWLTDAGCPVFAIDAGDVGMEEQAVAMLRGIGEDMPDFAEALMAAIEVISDRRRRPHDLTRAENLLFTLAEPRALATTTLAPKRARVRGLGHAIAADPTDPPRAAWPFSLSRHLDAEWADLVSRTTTGVWRAVRAPRSSRRRPWLVAGGLAALVLIGGVLWPTGEGGPATAVDEPVAIEEWADPSASPSERKPSPASPPASHASDLAATTAILLTNRTDCGDERDCLGAVLETRDAAFPPGAADLPADQRELALLDEFGGAAVLRVNSLTAGVAPQLVVIVRVDSRWLIRDVFDVADQ